jgi:tetratricopeptide (TPR) repeat protein
MIRQQMEDEVLDNLRDLDNISDETIKEISSELAKCEKNDLAYKFANLINDSSEFSNAMHNISSELAKQGKIIEALYCARNIVDKKSKLSLSCQLDQCLALKNISDQLEKKGKRDEARSVLNEAFECAKDIKYDFSRSRAMYEISLSFHRQGNWHLTEMVGMEIFDTSERHELWKRLANENFISEGWIKSISNCKKMKIKESQEYYNKGLAELINLENYSQSNLKIGFHHLKFDILSIEKILQVYAQRMLFFGNLEADKIDRLNKTLNIKWLVDIKNSIFN